MNKILTYRDIPKKMDNEESKLWANVFVQQRNYELCEANLSIAHIKLNKYISDKGKRIDT